MPIIGLTQDTKAIAEGLPIIGKLRKGSPKSSNKPGKDLDHFRFTPNAEYIEMGAQDAFHDIYGKTPAMFQNVWIVSDDIDEAFSTWLEWWTANETLQLRTNGVTVVREYKADLGVNSKPIGYVDSERPVLPVELENCKEVGRLNIMLPELIEALGVIGVVTVETHSKNDILNLHRYLTMVKRMYGKLIGIPYMFGRVDKEISTPGWTKRDGTHTGRQLVTKSLFTLHVMPEYVKTVMLPAIKANMIAVEAKPQLVASTDEPETPSLAATINDEDDEQETGPAMRVITKADRKTPIGRTPRTDGSSAIKDEPDDDTHEAVITEVTGDSNGTDAKADLNPHIDEMSYDIMQIRHATEKSGSPLRVNTGAGAFHIVYSSIDDLAAAGWPVEEWKKATGVVDIPDPYIEVKAVTAADPDNDGDTLLVIREGLTPSAPQTPPDVEGTPWAEDGTPKTPLAVWKYFVDTMPADAKPGKYFGDSKVTAKSSDDDKTNAVDVYMQLHDMSYTGLKEQIDQDADALKADAGKA